VSIKQERAVRRRHPVPPVLARYRGVADGGGVATVINRPHKKKLVEFQEESRPAGAFL
jgi:hypothetical protein